MSIQWESNFCVSSNAVRIGLILVVLCKTLEVCKTSMQRESEEDHVKTKQGNHGLRCFFFTRTPGCLGMSPLLPAIHGLQLFLFTIVLLISQKCTNAIRQEMPLLSGAFLNRCHYHGMWYNYIDVYAQVWSIEWTSSLAAAIVVTYSCGESPKHLLYTFSGRR